MSTVCWKPAYLGLGSNLNQPERQVSEALSQVANVKGVSLELSSRLYLSDPVGPAGQPDYVNAVAAILTTLLPLELLNALQAIEQLHGRDRTGKRWSARTLDIDILAYADQTIASDRLVVPHQELHNRDFVLGPWMDIAPDFQVPGLGSVRRLARGVDLGTLRVL